MKVKDMTPLMRETLTKKHPTLECPFADGEFFEESLYLSIRCSAVEGSCTYRVSGKDEYKSCKILKDRS